MKKWKLSTKFLVSLSVVGLMSVATIVGFKINSKVNPLGEVKLEVSKNFDTSIPDDKKVNHAYFNDPSGRKIAEFNLALTQVDENTKSIFMASDVKKENPLSLKEFLNNFIENYKNPNPEFVAEIGAMKFINEYFESLSPWEFVEYANWFMQNVSWGPDILSLESFVLKKGVVQDGGRITLGSHATINKEKKQITFYPDSFFGSLPIFSNSAGKGQFHDSLTRKINEKKWTKEELEEFLAKLPERLTIANYDKKYYNKGLAGLDLLKDQKAYIYDLEELLEKEVDPNAKTNQTNKFEYLVFAPDAQKAKEKFSLAAKSYSFESAKKLRYKNDGDNAQGSLKLRVKFKKDEKEQTKEITLTNLKTSLLESDPLKYWINQIDLAVLSENQKESTGLPSALKTTIDSTNLTFKSFEGNVLSIPKEIKSSIELLPDKAEASDGLGSLKVKIKLTKDEKSEEKIISLTNLKTDQSQSVELKNLANKIFSAKILDDKKESLGLASQLSSIDIANLKLLDINQQEISLPEQTNASIEFLSEKAQANDGLGALKVRVKLTKGNESQEKEITLWNLKTNGNEIAELVSKIAFAQVLNAKKDSLDLPLSLKTISAGDLRFKAVDSSDVFLPSLSELSIEIVKKENELDFDETKLEKHIITQVGKTRGAAIRLYKNQKNPKNNKTQTFVELDSIEKPTNTLTLIKESEFLLAKDKQNSRSFNIQNVNFEPNHLVSSLQSMELATFLNPLLKEKIKNNSFMDFYDLTKIKNHSIFLYEDEKSQKSDFIRSEHEYIGKAFDDEIESEKFFYYDRTWISEEKDFFVEDYFDGKADWSLVKKYRIKDYKIDPENKQKLTLILEQLSSKTKELTKESFRTFVFDFSQKDQEKLAKTKKLWETFKKALNWHDGLSPRLITEEQTINEKNEIISVFDIYSDIFGGLIDEIISNNKYSANEIDGFYVEKEIDPTTGLIKSVLKKGVHRGFYPTDRIGIIPLLKASAKEFKTTGINYLKYVGTHEYGHHQTLQYAQDVSDPSSVVIPTALGRNGINSSNLFNKDVLQLYLDARSSGLKVRKIHPDYKPNERGVLPNYTKKLIDALKKGQSGQNDHGHSHSNEDIWEKIEDVFGNENNKTIDSIDKVLSNKERRFLQTVAGIEKAAKTRNLQKYDLFILNSFDHESATINPELVGKSEYFKFKDKVEFFPAKDDNSNNTKSFFENAKVLSDNLGNLVEFDKDKKIIIATYKEDQANDSFSDLKPRFFVAKDKPLIDLSIFEKTKSLQALKKEIEEKQKLLENEFRNLEFETSFWIKGWNSSLDKDDLTKIEVLHNSNSENENHLQDFKDFVEETGFIKKEYVDFAELEKKYQNSSQKYKENYSYNNFLLAWLVEGKEVPNANDPNKKYRVTQNYINTSQLFTKIKEEKPSKSYKAITKLIKQRSSYYPNYSIFHFENADYFVNPRRENKRLKEELIRKEKNNYDALDIALSDYKKTNALETQDNKATHYYWGTFNEFKVDINRKEPIILDAWDYEHFGFGQDHFKENFFRTKENESITSFDNLENFFEFTSIDPLKFSLSGQGESAQRIWDIDYVLTKFNLFDYAKKIDSKIFEKITLDQSKKYNKADLIETFEKAYGQEKAKEKLQDLANDLMNKFESSSLAFFMKNHLIKDINVDHLFVSQLGILGFNNITKSLRPDPNNNALIQNWRKSPITSSDVRLSWKTENPTNDSRIVMDAIRRFLKENQIDDSKLDLFKLKYILGTQILNGKNDEQIYIPNNFQLNALNNKNISRFENDFGQYFSDYVFNFAESLTRDYVQTSYVPSQTQLENMNGYLKGFSEWNTGNEYYVSGSLTKKWLNQINVLSDDLERIRSYSSRWSYIEQASQFLHFDNSQIFENYSKKLDQILNLLIKKDFKFDEKNSSLNYFELLDLHKEKTKKLKDEATKAVQTLRAKSDLKYIEKFILANKEEQKYKINLSQAEKQLQKAVENLVLTLDELTKSFNLEAGNLFDKEYYNEVTKVIFDNLLENTNQYVGNFLGQNNTTNNGFFKDRWEKKELGWELYDDKGIATKDEKLNITEFDGKTKITNRARAFWIYSLKSQGIGDKTVSGIWRDEKRDAITFWGFTDNATHEKIHYISLKRVDDPSEKIDIPLNKQNTNNLFYFKKQASLDSKTTLKDEGFDSWITNFNILSTFSNSVLTALKNKKIKYQIYFSDKDKNEVQGAFNLGKTQYLAENGKAYNQAPVYIEKGEDGKTYLVLQEQFK
ncbi:PDxFFG protein [Mycoplasmopsis pulmonis]|uniref:PDxFFG protein n=1 Tax=Mycoplasmopsis pulmonis TaxID=2107 RepID=UPI002ACD5E8E|nr:PDxFFG protein [Mycoplasmopsis pulmonis]MDZ7293355.1 PDxFFG protein [Mycoplasmopsis pulmonis]